ncbi:hypothetical protein [uncultured Jatrophihabitans sp.]|uniref:hypothetical protein n=1 Tax=uncultured Jatrophihabitans sp. TaxID=1610747 RepID=UPI0035C97D9F
MALAVHLHQPPGSGFLLAWGHHTTGWYGCVAMRVRLVDQDDELEVAAWVPAHALTKPNWVHGGDVNRLELPNEPRTWHGPPRPAWYVGRWADGPLPLPPGLEMVTGAGWRNKTPRGLQST